MVPQYVDTIKFMILLFITFMTGGVLFALTVFEFYVRLIINLCAFFIGFLCEDPIVWNNVN